MNNYYFTFGTDERYPFRGGWIVIVAPDMQAAQQIFRAYFPDRVPGCLNCADCYTEEAFSGTSMGKNGNFRAYCHMIIGPREPKNKERRQGGNPNPALWKGTSLL